MPRTGQPTINDVARIAGVSKKTVSRVINRSPLLSPDMRKRVEDVIADLGYIPNPQARALALRRNFLIGLVHDNPNAQTVMNVQQGMLEALHGTEFEMVVRPVDRGSSTMLEDLRHFLERQRLFGVLLMPPVSENDQVAQTCVEIGCRYVRMGSAELDVEERMVASNDSDAVRAATAYLIECGHRRIGLIAGPHGFRSARERRLGFEAALTAAGISLPRSMIADGNYTFESGVVAAERLLDLMPRPTAIFSCNDEMAAGVIHAARARGLEVPRDLSVIGFDDTPIAAHIWPPLTTVRWPIISMARSAALKLIASEQEAVAEPSMFRSTLISAGVGGGAAKLTVELSPDTGYQGGRRDDGANKELRMTRPLTLDPDRLLPADPATRAIARALYAEVAPLPIVSPHGHTDARWFADDASWSDATSLLLAPDHYLYRMLYSQGVDLDALAIPRRDGAPATDPRAAWRLFAQHYYLFRGTPSRLWLDHVFAELFGIDIVLDAATADHYFDAIAASLATDAFRPRALFDRFNIDFLATTEGPQDDLSAHHRIRRSGWRGRVVTTYRPDAVIDAEHEAFGAAMKTFAELTGEDVYSWTGYLAAHRKRRADFRAAGATATDHGHPTAQTANLSPDETERLFRQIVSGSWTPADAELFRAQMLSEMAAMSIDDGMVMQIHPGSFRNHNAGLFASHGRDKGADIPTPTGYVEQLKPLLDRFGNDRALAIILFTLDETSYARELAPLAGHYPCLKLGPPWWFHDSPEGMRRFRETVTESAGFYNTIGFNDDTRAFLSIPARHDVARRIDCGFLARLVAEGRLADWEAAELALDLTSRLARKAYRIDEPLPAAQAA